MKTFPLKMRIPPNGRRTLPGDSFFPQLPDTRRRRQRIPTRKKAVLTADQRKAMKDAL